MGTRADSISSQQLVPLASVLVRRALARWLVCAALLAPCFAQPARANDSVMGGTATDLVPMTNANVRMLSEDILIREDGGYWEVRAHYVFVNQSKKDLTLQVGFPEHGCGPAPGEEDEGIDCVSKRPLDFENMQTTVNGVAVEHTEGKLDPKHAWAPSLGTVWLYEATFAGRKETHVSHRYRVAKSYDSMGGKSGSYVTRTGATWAGTIGHARFVVHVPANSFELYARDDLEGMRVTKQLVEVDGKKLGQIVFEARDWEPREDLWFGYLNHLSPWNDLPDFSQGPARAGFAADERCLAFAELWQAGHELSFKKSKQPDPALVQGFVERGIGSARICRNQVFAARGRRFDDDKLNRYFYGDKGFAPGSFPYQPFTPSPAYDQNQLTPGDWATLKLIEAIEARGATAGPAAEELTAPRTAEPPEQLTQPTAPSPRGEPVPATDPAEEHASPRNEPPSAKPERRSVFGCSVSTPVHASGHALLLLLTCATFARRRSRPALTPDRSSRRLGVGYLRSACSASSASSKRLRARPPA